MPLTILNLYWNFHTFLRLEKKYKNSLTFTCETNFKQKKFHIFYFLWYNKNVKQIRLN